MEELFGVPGPLGIDFTKRGPGALNSLHGHLPDRTKLG